MLRELARSYLTIVKDLTRVMNRLKALYRSWAIPCAGRDVYYTRHRTEWLGKIPEAGVPPRAAQLYPQLHIPQRVPQRTPRELLTKGIKPTMVRLTLARKIAAITLTLWKKGDNFDAEKLKAQAA